MYCKKQFSFLISIYTYITIVLIRFCFSCLAIFHILITFVKNLQPLLSE